MLKSATVKTFAEDACGEAKSSSSKKPVIQRSQGPKQITGQLISFGGTDRSNEESMHPQIMLGFTERRSEWS